MKKESQRDDVFELYKPFRNQLRGLELFDSLYVVWGFARNLTFDLPLPEDIQRPNNYNPRASRNNRRYRGLNDFELEFIYKELLLHTDIGGRPPQSLKTVDTLAKLINYVRHNLADKIDKKYVDRKEVMINFNRLFHQQFKWQQSYNTNAIFRYYKVFSAPAVNDLVVKVYGLSTWELYILGFFFFRLSGDQFKLPYPYQSKMTRLTNEMIARFFEIFSTDIPIIKAEALAAQEMNESLLYAFNPVTVHPILRHEDFFVCPIPLLLFWQVTSGTYYAIVKERGFNEAFGQAFETYVGEVLHNINTGRFNVSPEVVYGRPEKRSVDWLVEEEGAILFIECKSKRMTLNARTTAGLNESLTSDLNKMADFVFQLYKSYLDYAADNYPHRPFAENLNAHLLVLTFEPWYLEFNMDLREIVQNRVRELFEMNDMDIALLETHPCQFSSVEEFEADFQIMNEIGIGEYYRLQRADQLHPIVQGFEYRGLFREEFQQTFIEPLHE